MRTMRTQSASEELSYGGEQRSGEVAAKGNGAERVCFVLKWEKQHICNDDNIIVQNRDNQ